MKTLLISISILFIVSTAFAAEKEKPWSVKINESKIVTYPGEDCVTIDVNGKTTLRVCKCGSVDVLDYKNVVPNKDNVWAGTTFTISR